VGARPAARGSPPSRLARLAATLLDTTVLIDLLRGRGGARARLRALREGGDVPYTCAVNVEETVRGLSAAEEERAARALFEGLRMVSLGADEGWQAGEWRRAFARSGRVLSQADCLVAAAAHAIGGRLATGNPKDFPMRELSVEYWPTGD
jgi:predicted nucleic acid-binding protein